MTEAYALQIAGISLALSVLILGGLFVASRIFDRNTRRYEARKRD